MSELTREGERLKETNKVAFKKMCEAMTKSNGKVNNMLGVLLAVSETSTVEDIVNIASGIGTKEKAKELLEPVFGYNYDNKVWNVKSGRTKQQILDERRSLRKKAFDDKRTYMFEDTFLYRKMKQIGLSSKLENEKSYWGRSVYHTDNAGGYMGQLKDSSYVQPVIMFFHASEDLRTIILNDELLNEMWTEQAKIQRSIYKPYNIPKTSQFTYTDEEWRKFQIDHIIKEFDQLAHMPLKVKKEMNEWREWQKTGNKCSYWDEIKMPPIIMNTVLESFRYPGEDKNIELIREAYQVMDYMGIGITWKFVDGTRTDEEGNIKNTYQHARKKEVGYRVGAMLRHVSSTMRRFAADIKKGFDVEDVRELVVEDLNRWATTQTREHWQFFERDDAPKDYPELQKKKKAKKSTVKTENLELTEVEKLVVEKFNESKNNKENKENGKEYES